MQTTIGLLKSLTKFYIIGMSLSIPKNLFSTSYQTDKENLKQDWEAIGHDFRTAEQKATTE